MHRIFPIRTCSYYIDEKLIKDKKIKVCLDYHIKKCQGPCEGLVNQQEYTNMIALVIDFLKGKSQFIKQEVSKLMEKASIDLRFEEAAKYRDQLNALEIFNTKQKQLVHCFIDQDIIHVSSKDIYGIGFVMRIRNGLLVGREKFDIKVIDCSLEKLLNGFLIQYYNSTFDIPKEIIIDIAIKDKEIIEKWLSSKKGSKMKFIYPRIGEKRKILDLCKKNSEMILKDILIKKIKRKEFVPKILSELQEILSMPVIPKRIEAFDNSNLQGTNAVSGMVCFVDGKPLKKEYRKFNIRTVDGIDDFKSMREVVYRRYSRQLKENNILPDLILIDGGKGQLSAAKSSLDKLGLGYITIIGLAKKIEEVFIP